MEARSFPLVRYQFHRMIPSLRKNYSAAIAVRVMRNLGIIAGFATLLPSCQTIHHRKNHDPLVSGGDSFVAGPSAENGAIPPTPWWKAFRDPELSGFIESALKSNLTAQQFASRIKQADARKRKTGAGLFPSIELVADAARRDNHRLNDTAATSHERTTSIGFLLDWEADVWGKLSAASQAAQLDVEAARYDWLGAQLLLTSSVSQTYLEILEQRQLLQLLKDQVAVNETLAKLTELRYGQGQASIVDILQQR